MTVVVADAVERKRYEAELDGTLAGVLEYIVKHDRIALIHTEVKPAFEGHGVAAGLTRFALAEASRRGLEVIVICPYGPRYLQTHPADIDIVLGPSVAEV